MQRTPRQAVGETFEDQFMREVEQLRPHRNRRPPRRLFEECYATSLTADIDEPSDIDEAWNGEFGVQRKEATNAEYESMSHCNVIIHGTLYLYRKTRTLLEVAGYSK